MTVAASKLPETPLQASSRKIAERWIYGLSGPAIFFGLSNLPVAQWPVVGIAIKQTPDTIIWKLFLTGIVLSSLVWLTYVVADYLRYRISKLKKEKASEIKASDTEERVALGYEEPTDPSYWDEPTHPSEFIAMVFKKRIEPIEKRLRLIDFGFQMTRQFVLPYMISAIAAGICLGRAF